jgi:molecular chaperone DnaK
VEIHVLQGEREMAAHNKTLGRFQLTGIPPAPRGIPQIEVTFDIDANGIVHVSAKDLGTGNEQKVTITASTNMSKDDIDKAVKDAEKFAAEDKKEKERVEIRNNADALVFQTEKTLKDLGDKVSSEDKGKLDAELSNVMSALAGTDTDIIKSATERLSQVSYDVFGKVYQQANAQQNEAGGGYQQGGYQAGPQPGADAGSAPKEDDVVDADYNVVDDDKKNK